MMCVYIVFAHLGIKFSQVIRAVIAVFVIDVAAIAVFVIDVAIAIAVIQFQVIVRLLQRGDVLQCGLAFDHAFGRLLFGFQICKRGSRSGRPFRNHCRRVFQFIRLIVKRCITFAGGVGVCVGIHNGGRIRVRFAFRVGFGPGFGIRVQRKKGVRARVFTHQIVIVFFVVSVIPLGADYFFKLHPILYIITQYTLIHLFQFLFLCAL